MAMIFPGMDPYLEDPLLWPGVHNAFIVYLRDQLRPLLRPRYIAAVEERAYIQGYDRPIEPDVWVGRRAAPGPGDGDGLATVEEEMDAPTVVRVPEVEAHESYLAILDHDAGGRVVAVIELVSPANKYAGAGRDSYIRKQREVLDSEAHLVEIDLLRKGPHVLAVPEWLARGQGDYAYMASVNRAGELRDEFELYPRGLRQRLPRVRLPLAEGDPDVPLDLAAALAHTYEAGDYRLRIDYGKPCRPPLSAEDQSWADELIRRAGAAPEPGR